MADHNQQPQFLGGGPKFNPAGAQPHPEEATETPVAPAHRSRNWIIIIALLVLVALLYAVMAGPNGLTQRPGRGGISPTAHTISPDNGNPQ